MSKILQRIAQLGVGHQRPLLVILKLHRAEKERLRVDRAVAIPDCVQQHSGKFLLWIDCRRRSPESGKASIRSRSRREAGAAKRRKRPAATDLDGLPQAAHERQEGEPILQIGKGGHELAHAPVAHPHDFAVALANRNRCQRHAIAGGRIGAGRQQGRTRARTNIFGENRRYLREHCGPILFRRLILTRRGTNELRKFLQGEAVVDRVIG